MKQTIILTLLWLASFSSSAQFTMQGKIEFERKTNLHRSLDDMKDENGSNSWVDRVKAQSPKFKTSYFNYEFTTEKSLYQPGKETEEAVPMFGTSPAADNVVEMDFKTKQVKAIKNVFEEKFRIEDSLPRFTWKIYDEIRTIAQYQCRKAVTVISDSVYVVAFYTEDIPISGGPEMFNGLPGMILQIAIPRLHTTWIATKIELTTPDKTKLQISQKGKKVTQKEMLQQLQASIHKWGNWAQRAIWWCVI